MKKHRKQVVNVFGQKQLVDVPVDQELYTADRHEEYQRVRSAAKHIPLDEVVLADETADVTEAYEEAQLLVSLSNALKTLNEKERRLVKYLFYDSLTEREVATILSISQPAVTKQKHRIILKLRNSLIDWM